MNECVMLCYHKKNKFNSIHFISFIFHSTIHFQSYNQRNSFELYTKSIAALQLYIAWLERIAYEWANDDGESVDGRKHFIELNKTYSISAGISHFSVIRFINKIAAAIQYCLLAVYNEINSI